MIYTTFSKAKEAGACEVSYRKFAKYKGIKKTGKDNPIPLIEILDVCGLEDTLWAIANCATEPEKAKRLSKLFACDCADHVVHIYEKQYSEDNRPRNAIEVSRKYIDGRATETERAASWDASRAASLAASRAASSAASWAARAASWDAEREWQTQRLKELLEGGVK